MGDLSRLRLVHYLEFDITPENLSILRARTRYGRLCGTGANVLIVHAPPHMTAIRAVRRFDGRLRVGCDEFINFRALMSVIVIPLKALVGRNRFAVEFFLPL